MYFVCADTSCVSTVHTQTHRGNEIYFVSLFTIFLMMYGIIFLTHSSRRKKYNSHLPWDSEKEVKLIKCKSARRVEEERKGRKRASVNKYISQRRRGERVDTHTSRVTCVLMLASRTRIQKKKKQELNSHLLECDMCQLSRRLFLQRKASMSQAMAQMVWKWIYSYSRFVSNTRTKEKQQTQTSLTLLVTR